MGRLRARWLLALAVVVLGLAIGIAGAFAYSRTEKTLYRADVALIAQTGSQPVTGGVLRTIRDLVKTDIVAENVIRNQQLSETTAQFYDSLHIATAGSVITVGVDDPNEDTAVRIAQELSIVFTQLVRDRFGTGSNAAQVSIFDPAHGVGKVSPRVDRDLGWGALFGALLGLLAANVLVLRGRRGVWMPMPLPYEQLPALGPGGAMALPAASAPPYLGSENGEIAEALIAQAAADPFQTVLVAGDPDSAVTAGVAHELAARGELTMWLRGSDADLEELDRLAARCAFVLVSSPAFDAALAGKVDAVVAVTDGTAPNWPGVRLVGTVFA
jgi:capsular polysaccharide biosynthesis protein